MLAKFVLRLVPSVVRAVMMTTAIRAAIRPYSMAVAPPSSLKIFRKAMAASVSMSGSYSSTYFSNRLLGSLKIVNSYFKSSLKRKPQS